jgi:methionine-rich copper-binding protein CopC
MRWTPLGALATLVGAVALALAAPLAASAHDTLSSSTPADGATVDSLDAVTLTFSDVLLELGEDQQSTAIQVRQNGRYFETDCPALSNRTVSVPVGLGAAGEYEVVWQVVSADGHPVSGSYTFTYAPASGTAEAAGAAQPACGQAATAAAGPSDDAVLLGAAVGVVAIAAVGVAIVVLLGRRRSRAATPVAAGDDRRSRAL